MISSSQRPLPDNAQHSQLTNIHAPARIRTQNPSKRAAADQRLRPHGHWDRHDLEVPTSNTGMINIHIPKGILVYLKADADSTFTQIAATPFLKNKMKHRDSTVEEWPHAFSTSTLYRSGDLYDPAASLSRNSTDMRLDRMDWPQIWRLGVEGYCCI